MNYPSESRMPYQRLAPESRATMIAVRREFRMAYMRNSKAPFTGPYYWLPLSEGNWELISFADKFYQGHAAHVRIWPEVVNILALKWCKEPEKLERHLKDFPYSLPRGRALRMANGQWGIAHGDDAPRGVSLAKVRREFNLSSNAREFFDVHETMIGEQLHETQSILKRDLGLAEHLTLDFGDEGQE